LGGPVDPIGLPAVSVRHGLVPERRYSVALDRVTAVWRALTSTPSWRTLPEGISSWRC